MNDIIRGYVILTLESLDYSKDVISNLINELDIQFKTITEEEAKQYYLSDAWKK